MQLDAERQNVVKASKKADRTVADLRIKLEDADKAKDRLQNEIASYENRMLSMRQQHVALVRSCRSDGTRSEAHTHFDSNRPRVTCSFRNDGRNAKSATGRRSI